MPATVNVPERPAPVLAATENETVPSPLSEAPRVTVIHVTFEAAVHAQLPPEAVTAIDPVPPASDIDWLVGEMLNVQGGGAAACDTVNVLPATVIVAVRADPALADAW